MSAGNGSAGGPNTLPGPLCREQSLRSFSLDATQQSGDSLGALSNVR